MSEVTADFDVARVAVPGPARRLMTVAAVVVASLVCVSDAGVRTLGRIGDGLGLFSLNDAGSDPVNEGDDAAAVAARSVVIQTGEGNLAGVLAFGPVQSLISQFGQDNVAQVRQDGQGLVSVVEQGRTPGLTSVFENELAQRPSANDPFGGVSGNRAFIDQAGTNNRSVVGQFGSGSVADVIQRGAGNLSSIFQSGTDASAFVSQAGERNGSVIVQHDFAVRANVVQTGQDGLSEARQWDKSSGSIAQVFQAGSRNMSDIDQAGIRNLATVVQWDMGERAASTVIQDGDLGEARVDQVGVELVSIVRQGPGERNQAVAFQAGSDNVSEIVQSGSGHLATTRQSDSGNRSSIIQSGSGNVAAVTQSAL